MFHGFIKRSGRWLRLLTAAPLLGGDNISERFDGGSYKPAFLDHFFPDKYRVEVRRVNRKRAPDKTWSDPAVHTEELFSGEVIRWSTASDQYMLRIKGAKGWLSSFKEIGLIIRNSKKMSKRLTELVRLTSMWLFDGQGSLKVEVIDHTHPECYVDGISAISRALALRCIRSNVEATRRWRARQIWRIHFGITANVSFRMLTPDGLIKGNALILPRRMMGGFDVRTFKPNIKPEIRTSGWQWVTIDPTYGAIPVKSDDLTHAIYRRVNGLYDDETLLASLEGMLEKFFDDLKEGKRSDWLTRLVDSENVRHEEVEERFDVERTLSTIIQEKIAELHRLGVPLSASQTLMFLSVNGLKQMVVGKSTAGNTWKDKTRHWFPVPWAYAAHVMTKEVLEVFGFKMPKGDFGFYHEATHSFVVPGAYFQANLANHGGPDLDDTIKVHVRTIQGKLTAFLLRNPNDFGEWSMIPIKEAGPVFHAYTDKPPVVDYDELTRAVPQFSMIKDQIEVGELPGVKTLTIGEVFSLEDEKRVRSAAQAFPAGTGGAVLPKMLHAALVGRHIMRQFASNESIIDALQQGSATPEDVMVIQMQASATFRSLPGYIDAFWYHTRLFEDLIMEYGFSCGEEADSPWVSLHLKREATARASIGVMVDWLNEHITKPQILDEIVWTPQEIADAPGELAKIKQAKNASSNWVEDFVKMLQASDEKFGEERTNRKILRLANQAFIAKALYPRANHDQWLYTFSTKCAKQPIDWFLRALRDSKETNR